MRTRNQGLLLVVTATLLAATWGCGGGTHRSRRRARRSRSKGPSPSRANPWVGASSASIRPISTARDAPVATLEIGKDGTYSGETLGRRKLRHRHQPDHREVGNLSANRQAIALNSGENTVNIDL